jgi:hypothetical protein
VIVLGIQAMGNSVCGLKAVPVDSRNPDIVVVRVQNLATAGVPIAHSLAMSQRLKKEKCKGCD